MRVYNIRNGKKFFETLAASEGAVELVHEDGKHLQITPGRMNGDLIPMTYFDGTIRSLELCFQKKADCSRMLAYLMGSR